MTTPIYSPNPERYDAGMNYRRAGRSGILLPEISLGLWHNFGDIDPLARSFEMAHYAFDHGIVHFDLANNYGPSYGSAEATFGKIMKKSFAPYRDELFISSKAGYDMWPGPYGNWGSRKYLISSLDQSLKRMNLDYVDIFYTHRFDPVTPLEETLQALVDIVRSGRALYVGISRYPHEAAQTAYDYLRERDVPCLLYQGKYNILNREPEIAGGATGAIGAGSVAAGLNGSAAAAGSAASAGSAGSAAGAAGLSILEQAKANGAGFISFSPLAQGLLTDRYLHGIPSDSRMATKPNLSSDALTPQMLEALRKLDGIAAQRGQKLAEMALAWVLKNDLVTSVIIGASSVAQIETNLKAIRNCSFSEEELATIEEAVRDVKTL